MTSSFAETDLMGWSSPSNNSGGTNTVRNLAKPLIPTVNFQSPPTINNPFDAICEKINNEIQNPFDDICSLVEMQTAKKCQKEDNVVNLLNMTIISTSKEDLLSTSNPDGNTSTPSDVSDVLNVSSLDDDLLGADNDKVAEDMQLMTLLDGVQCNPKTKENNNCLSQSQCDFSQINKSLNDSCYEHGQRYHELCSKLDSSFNKTKTLFVQIVSHDQKALAAFKRRSAEFSDRKEREEEAVIEKTLSTSQTICSKSALKPLESPDLKLRTCSSLKSLPSARATRETARRSTRQGPLRALAPLTSMIKSNNALPDKVDLKSADKSQAVPLFKSSYHKSPIKQLNLRSKSAGATPRLASSTPEKCSTISRPPAFTSPSPLKSIRSTSPLKSIRYMQTETNSSLSTSPLKPIQSTSLKPVGMSQKSIRSLRLPSPLKSVATSPIKSLAASPLKSVATSPIRLTSPLQPLKSVSASQLRARGSPLKCSSANVGGGLAVPAGVGLKPRSSSLSRLKPPRSVASKNTRFNSSHDEKENFAVHYVA